MSNRQRNYTPTIEDSWFDLHLEVLKKHYGIEKHSELITRVVIDAAREKISIKL